jgi:hypothetical protein
MGHIGPGIDAGPGHDAGNATGMDGGTVMTGAPCAHTYECTPGIVCYMGHCTMGGPQDAGMLNADGGCIPTVEICGDHIDQNCDHHDESCGDTDMDNWPACRPPIAPATTVDYTMCDCDDTDPNTFPASGSVPGGTEICDGKDNDCDFVVDESPSCCTSSPSCTSLANQAQADVCTGGAPNGVCGCAGNPGGAPCATGQTCCGSGCVDTNTDFNNCGTCNSMCTNQADTCAGGSCHCGTGLVCQFTYMCHGGACM